MSYRAPVAVARYEQIIKKSRFIAIASAVPVQHELTAFLDGVATEFPDARHICYASIIGPPETGQQIFADDGEPAGTAGKPILNVLQHSGVGDIAIAVVRYFGGIKLGAGGLVRAYSSSASGVMTDLSTSLVEQNITLRLQVDYPLENDIRHLLGEFGIKDINVSYEGRLELSCEAPLRCIETLRNRLISAARGKIQIRVSDPD